MSKKATNPPVFYTIVQAQFNPIAAMINYINEIQDKLRLDGYTLFDQQKITQLQFDTAVPGKAEVVEHPIWRITKSDRKSGFILSQSHLVYHTTHYQTHNEFFENFLLGLQKIHSIVKLDHLSRLGLRYLNAILPIKDESIDRFLIKEVHGVNVDANPRYSLYESVFDTKIESISFPGTLVNRIYCRSGQLGYPPDIAPHDLLQMPQFDKMPSILHAVVDIDHFIEGQMPLDSERIKKHLTALHKKIKEAFKATVTDYAIKAWGL